MRIKNTNRYSDKKRGLTVATIIGALLVVALIFMYITKTGLFMPIASNNNDNTSLSKDEKSAADTTKQQATENAKNNTDGTAGNPLPPPTPPPSGSTAKPTVGLDITSINQGATTLHIRTIVQTISSNGTCSLSMDGPSGKKYTVKVDSQALPSSSTCKGFDIPLASLAKGSWTATVTYEDASVTATATKEVTVQ